MRKRIRRPGRMPKHPDIYADFDERPELHGKFLYIGGPYYRDHAQIHLTLEQAEHLGAWLGKVSAYLKAKRKAVSK